jgi:hypothetical protein
MIVKSILSYRLWRQPILEPHNEVVAMQANKHSRYSRSIYNSSYNTQAVGIQSRVEIAEGKRTQSPRSVEPVDSNRSCASQVRGASFDFAGLAG